MSAIVPRYMLAKAAPPTAPVSTPRQSNGGGGRSVVVMDQLTLLCKQHQLQYKTVEPRNDTAGVPLPFEKPAPTFFAWKKEDMVVLPIARFVR